MQKKVLSANWLVLFSSLAALAALLLFVLPEDQKANPQAGPVPEIAAGSRPLRVVQAGWAEPGEEAEYANGEVPASDSTTPGGKLELPGESGGRYYDFGAVKATDTLTHDFYLINRGDAPLVIRQAYTTCQCTTGELSARVVPPGKAVRATIIFDAGLHDVRGKTVRRGLVLETSDPDQPVVELWIQARVR